MITLQEIIKEIQAPDQQAREKALERWSHIAKPLNSLGVLERDLTRIAAASRNPQVDIEKKTVVVMCADNGIVEEGVTQTGQDVTAKVAASMAKGQSCVCLMAGSAGADVIPVDVGMAQEIRLPGLLSRPVRRGTRNFLKAPAMTRQETVQAMETGAWMAGRLKQNGVGLAGSGEMGIGNTTTSSAVLSVLLQVSPEQVTGRGAGLDQKGYERKIQVIREGIRLHDPDPKDSIDVLSKVGGLDLAALTGFYLGCAYYHIPVVLDGLITSAAALAAVRLCPLVQGYMLASHVSAEPAGAMALEALKLEPAIQASMCLGEGTGAAALFALLDMTAQVYHHMSTFDQLQVQEYRPLI